MNTTTDTQILQVRKCHKYGVQPVECDHDMKVGISLNVKEGILPLNGLRCNPSGDTCGWYIWAGQWSDEADFFKPLHVNHLSDWCPQVLPFLKLPPGWRFLVTPNHEDVWRDEDLVL